MLFKPTFTAVALLLVGQAIASPVAKAGDVDVQTASNDIRDTSSIDAAQVATDPYYACSCPDNCKHKLGSSCKYYAGPSDSSKVMHGNCAYFGSHLWCTPK